MRACHFGRSAPASCGLWYGTAQTKLRWLQPNAHLRRPVPPRDHCLRPAPPPPPPEPPNLLWPLLAVTAALGWILLPFFGALLWAAVVAQLFMPVQRALLRRLRGRRTLAAALTLSLALVIVIVPAAIISGLLANEAVQVYERLKSGDWDPSQTLRQLFNALPDPVRRLLRSLDVSNFATLQQRLSQGVSQGSQFIATRVFVIGQDTFSFFVDMAITSYVAFFLIRDGEALVRQIRRAVPLPRPLTDELIAKFANVVRATVRGNLLVAAIQGILGGLAFWFLGVGAALLWGVLMAFLSLLPAVGAGLVWVPVALWLFASGATGAAFALVAWGVLVIGLVDNLLRPVLVGKDTRMPDAVVMVSTLGGMAVFGLNGFIIGPTIAAMFIAVWHIHVQGRTADD